LYIIRITGILKPVLGHEKAEASVGSVRAQSKKSNACATQSDWSDVPAEIPSWILGTPPVSQPPSLHYLLVAYLRLLRVGNAFFFSLSSVLFKPANKIPATPKRRRKREEIIEIGGGWSNAVSDDIGAFAFSSSRLYADSITGAA